MYEIVLIAIGIILGGIFMFLITKFKEPFTAGTVFVVDGNSMYIELDDENAFETMKQSRLVVFRMKHKHTQD